ncbi:MAG TPA: glycosyltransferase family 4 protein [Solirubrobacteraceae bacterium]
MPAALTVKDAPSIPPGERSQPTDRAERSELALVIWDGRIGGSESLGAALAAAIAKLGAQMSVIFICQPEPLAQRLREAGVHYRTLGLNRGGHVLAHCRRLARLAGELGPDGTLLEERGLMCLALRAGGYRAPMVAVEHGSVLLDERQPPSFRRARRALTRALAGTSVDVEVAVSDFMLTRLSRTIHAKHTLRIYNGIDPDVYSAADRRNGNGPVRIGFAGRLVPGKGVEELLEASALAAERQPLELLIAGRGSERERLEAHAARRGSPARVRFLGHVEDMPAFWAGCDIAVIPSGRFTESFSMTTLEAMCCERAVIATRNGAIPELMVDGQTGTLVAPDDVEGMSNALLAYARSPNMRREHGRAARSRAREKFHIERCADAYLRLFAVLATNKAGRR